jgi:hypothetical protein
MLKSLFFSAGRTAGLCAAAGVLSVGIGACGSASSTSTTGSAGGASVASSGSAGTRYQARLAFAKCMRAHGVNVPDPSPNAGPAGGGGDRLRNLRSSPNFQAANRACASLRAKAFGFGNLSPAQRAQVQRDLVKFAQCMRSHKIDIPDPSTSTGGGFGILRQIPDSERNSPAFQSALQACSSSLPRFGRGGPGGPPAGAPGGAGASTGA